jgi:iron complex transport system permease protein
MSLVMGVQSAGRIAGDRSAAAAVSLAALAALLVLVALIALGTGPAPVPVGRVVEILLAGPGAGVGGEGLIIWQIRVPRILVGALVGATLAVSGALMQGLFRNPLADPGLVGVSSGAALGAVSTIVLGSTLLLPLTTIFGGYSIAFAAFVMAFASTLLLYTIATRGGRTSVATMLLAGIALGAFSAAATGLLVFTSSDQQLRDITFWSLGGLGGASWSKLAIAGPIMLLVLVAMPALARGLNAYVLGEAEAFHLGIHVQRLKFAVIFLVAAGTGAAVATSGVIGFVGIVVPHLLRLAMGPNHQPLLPACALGGAVLLLAADMVARTIVAPAELPIGILTAAIGAPFFLWMLLRRRGLLDL